MSFHEDPQARYLPMIQNPHVLVERFLARPACLVACRGIWVNHIRISGPQESPSSRHLPCTHLNVQTIEACVSVLFKISSSISSLLTVSKSNGNTIDLPLERRCVMPEQLWLKSTAKQPFKRIELHISQIFWGASSASFCCQVLISGDRI